MLNHYIFAAKIRIYLQMCKYPGGADILNKPL